MRQAPEGLKVVLSRNQFAIADLYTIETSAGGIYRYTDHDNNLIVDNVIYRSDGPIISRDDLSWKVGIELDSLSATIEVNDDVMLGSVGFIQAVHNGHLDGAKFTLSRIFIDDVDPLNTTDRVIKLFSGVVADCEFSRTALKVDIKSELDALKVQMPRNLWQPSCKNTLFDSICGLSRDDFSIIATVEAGTTLNRIVCTLNQAQGYYSQGVVQCIDGANQSIKRTIKEHENGALSLTLPLLTLPQIGERLLIYSGCDKRLQTCNERYNNQAKFRGEPFIPVPETAI